MNRNVFNIVLAQYTSRHTVERPGQRVFNTVAMIDPSGADSERGGPCDPFYDDSKVEPFLAKTLSLLLTSGES